MNITIIYIGDYSQQEEETLKGVGISTIRVDSPKAISATLKPQDEEKYVIVRGSRLSVEEYSALNVELKSLKYNLINAPDLFILHGSFARYYPMIKSFSPKSIFLERNSDIPLIKQSILEAHLSIPLFVRSEIESAAKYVGIEGCIINEIANTDIEKCKENLDNNIKSYQSIIIKEIIEIKKHSNGKNLEYRAIIINDKVIAFDYDMSILPSPNEYGIDAEVRKIVEAIFQQGFKGAYFMDFALTINGEVIIVESKDILNGTIKNILGFGKGLLL